MSIQDLPDPAPAGPEQPVAPSAPDPDLERLIRLVERMGSAQTPSA